MKIKLLAMKIRNFKHMKEFEFSPDGKTVAVHGQAGAGKTSLYDAFTFALFGKNSTGATDFEWRPKDENNEPIQDLETEVELTLLVNDDKVTLSRMVVGKWVRGEFRGNTTTCRINGVKKKLIDYKKYIDSLIDEKTFKLITNIFYFSDSEDIKYKERRAILFDLVGDMTDEEVIKRSGKLSALLPLIEGSTVDDRREQWKEEHGKLKKDVKEWSIRIDEADRNLPNVDHLDKKELEANKAAFLRKVDELNQEVALHTNNSAVTAKRTKLIELKANVTEARSLHGVKKNEETSDLQNLERSKTDEVYTQERVIAKLTSEASDYLHKVERLENEINWNNKQLDRLRQEFSEIHMKVTPHMDEHALTCPTCQRDYEADKLEDIKSAHAESVKQFNLNKSKELENNNAQGKAIADKNKEINVEILALEKAREDIIDEKLVHENEVLAKLKKELVEITNELAEKNNLFEPFEETEIYKALSDQVAAVEKEMLDLATSADGVVSALRQEVNAMTAGVNGINAELDMFESLKRAETRKLQLIEEQREKAARVGELDALLNLLDQFIREKVSMLTDKINSEFAITKFKLFHQPIDGDLEEVCQPLFKGVEFKNGISNNERINVGIDIINTISRLKGISVPIFIDNAESVTVWYTKPDAQSIHLVADAGHKTLKVTEKEEI